ncbi:alginate export family protein [Pararcticibacter amylolyticus]|uniref:Alginate export domain-containing protein n=1 Tax=Pararcticibacter amylolyticus TaxID=2173175 RepID=A0A2U2PFI4_9SPHI|nr:alginate export family protein [Pararcticibacter amylolyticus]PWG80168.1 hypothetical protein DDR33_13305 [Pararcticibacter amylolyticus]
MRKSLYAGWVFVFACYISPAYSQFNIDGQFIPRAEFRNGYGKLISKDADPAAFVAHRLRLQAGYKQDAFTFYASVQDIRTWGSTSQAKISDDFLSLYEAWLETGLGNNWKIRIGRQELNFDNARFLGNLDWALQGRSHDFIQVKYEKDKLNFQLGGGFNQDGQKLSGNVFTVANQYKAAQFARLGNTAGPFEYSLLLWNDGRQFTRNDASGAVAEKHTYYRQTIGLPTLKYKVRNTLLSGFYYYQLGKDPQGRKMRAYDASALITQQLNIDSAVSRTLRIAGGAEILSGTSGNNTASVNRSFSPLYGTNHAHNGYMDLFYVGGAHENSVGLQDYFVKARLDFNSRFFTQLDGHGFFSQANAYNSTGERMKRHLGTELDLSAGYIFNQAISLQGGYSQFFHSDTFETIQNNGTLKKGQNWAYVMLIFRPTMKNKFIGVLL